MTALILIKRNIKLFFKDKGMFFTSLITPAILLVLYVTFLGNIYRDSFLAGIPPVVTVEEGVIDGLVATQLISSILAVSCVTVAFCSNFMMVQDRASGARRDLTVSPVRPHTLSLCYFAATLCCTLLICYAALVVCFVYVAVVGWYLSVADVFWLILDVFLLVLFGTALSSVVNFFLSTQGQISAVGAIVSAGYGFLCGAYMPISSFGEGLRTAIGFLPGTCGTSLLRNHAMQGAFSALSLPEGAVEAMRDAVDCNLYLFGTQIEQWVMYLILAGATVLLLALYVLLNAVRKR